MAWIQPEIQEWILMTGPGLVKNKKLNNDILLLITKFLAPLIGEEAQNFSKMMFTKYRPEFLSKLEKQKLLLTTDLSSNADERPTKRYKLS